MTAVASQDYVEAGAIALFNEQQSFRIVSLHPIPGPPIEAIYRLAVAARWLFHRRPHLLVASGERSVWLGAILARSFRVPYVAIGHAMEFCVPSRWEKMLTRWSFAKASGVVCVSRYTWNAMRALGVRPKQGDVIHNGADEERFRPVPPEAIAQLRAEFGLAGRRIIVTLGSVSDRKGQEVVIRALPEVLKRVPSAHYIMAGRPAKQVELTKLATTLGVEHRVTFAGQVDAQRAVEILNIADVFAMTSRKTADGDFEGFGIAVVEAALCGIPAVVSTNSGLEEAIVHGQTGLAVPQNDAASTAEALIALLGDDGQRMRFGLAARERALSSQTWTRRSHEYDRFLRQFALAGP